MPIYMNRNSYHKAQQNNFTYNTKYYWIYIHGNLLENNQPIYQRIILIIEFNISTIALYMSKGGIKTVAQNTPKVTCEQAISREIQYFLSSTLNFFFMPLVYYE